MPFMLLREAVGDYDAWKTDFDACLDDRKGAGCRGGFVFRNISDAKEVLVLLEFEDLERMQQYLKSPGFRDSRAHAGTSGKPPADVLELLLSQPL